MSEQLSFHELYKRILKNKNNPVGGWMPCYGIGCYQCPIYNKKLDPRKMRTIRSLKPQYRDFCLKIILNIEQEIKEEKLSKLED